MIPYVENNKCRTAIKKKSFFLSFSLLKWAEKHVFHCVLRFAGVQLLLSIAKDNIYDFFLFQCYCLMKGLHWKPASNTPPRPPRTHHPHVWLVTSVKTDKCHIAADSPTGQLNLLDPSLRLSPVRGGTVTRHMSLNHIRTNEKPDWRAHWYDKHQHCNSRPVFAVLSQHSVVLLGDWKGQAEGLAACGLDMGKLWFGGHLWPIRRLN